ncbi:MAG: hypothetical protein HC883_02910 [Bdellovibrionaceae bacterium]|nr:hypothetical protein [Pseudobdellovibrionaceae bacterium]
MFNVKRILAVLVLSLSFQVWAGGTMQLSGEVHSFDADTIQVSDGQNVYTVKRTEIYNKAPLAKTLKVGQHVEVTVSFEGVIEIKPVKKKK